MLYKISFFLFELYIKFLLLKNILLFLKDFENLIRIAAFFSKCKYNNVLPEEEVWIQLLSSQDVFIPVLSENGFWLSCKPKRLVFLSKNKCFFLQKELYLMLLLLKKVVKENKTVQTAHVKNFN